MQSGARAALLAIFEAAIALRVLLGLLIGVGPSVLIAIALMRIFARVGIEPWKVRRGTSPPSRCGSLASAPALSRQAARQHPSTWSSTIPADCMRAYIVVGPTNRNP